ncbi:hypothetical protein POM88_028120 [Heracleum sosnowskyi]|uniref:Uncharacterized protein n=1 Tax=Heracleum sosnowskyi TaxID=360622 RepID=A0AAD8MQ65_9APIA|nr:hypothetical protein POM88_028120 [Heracleum sosnowskyi]
MFLSYLAYFVILIDILLKICKRHISLPRQLVLNFLVLYDPCLITLQRHVVCVCVTACALRTLAVYSYHKAFQLIEVGFAAPVGKSKKLFAAVAWRAGEAMVIEEVEVSPPQPMEIRIKVVATALCRSDFNAWLSQATPHLFPRIFGHDCMKHPGLLKVLGKE